MYVEKVELKSTRCTVSGVSVTCLEFKRNTKKTFLSPRVRLSHTQNVYEKLIRRAFTK